MAQNLGLLTCPNNFLLLPGRVKCGLNHLRLALFFLHLCQLHVATRALLVGVWGQKWHEQDLPARLHS